jgi:STE24 endopeptidase
MAALAALVGLGIALGVAVITLVPWQVPSPSRADQAAALRDVPAGVVSKGRALHAALRPGSYGSLLLGLVVVLLLGLTAAGPRIVAWVARPFGGHWLAEALLGGLVIMLIGSLVSLPFAAWRQKVLPPRCRPGRCVRRCSRWPPGTACRCATCWSLTRRGAPPG